MPDFRHKLAGPSMRQPNLPHVRARIERPVQLHRGHRIEPPFRQRFMALPQALEGPRAKTSPPASEHGQEFAAEPELLRRGVNSRAPADSEGVSAIAPPGEGDESGVKGIRQAGGARSDGENGLAHGRLWETNSQLVAE